MQNKIDTLEPIWLKRHLLLITQICHVQRFTVALLKSFNVTKEPDFIESLLRRPLVTVSFSPSGVYNATLIWVTRREQ